MAKRTIKLHGKNTEVNGEGPEKDDGTSSSLADLATYVTSDDNAKVAGLAKGYKSHPN
jgi:hypothetical protein